MHNLTLAFALACALLATACATNSQPGAATHEAISPKAIFGEWNVELIDNSPLVEQSAAFIGFDEADRMHGHGGVNSIFGSWTLDAGTLRIAQLGSTRMAGPPKLMEQERRLLAALERAARATVGEHGHLILLSANGALLIKASPRLQ